MINPHYREMLSSKSVIRELAEYAGRRGAEIGPENVFDFSLGNPSAAPPESFEEALVRLTQERDPVRLHGYSPTLGIPSLKEAIAESLNRRFSMDYGPEHIFPASGAAGALAHALRAVTVPGDEVLVFAPFFPEYKPYIEGTGAVMRVVPADFENFQIPFGVLGEYINERTAAVLINSPNNPSGAVYSEETLRRLSGELRTAQDTLGHPIYLISDEPYREIVFDERTVPYPASFYDNTLTCYSFSKSLSVPGERIGYVAVNPRAEGAEILVPMFGQISRGTGHNCPASIIQLAVADSLDDTADLAVYETNMELIYECFTDLGVRVVKPGGTFYIMPEAPGGDSIDFCKAALDYDLIFVPADNFGAPGYFRIAYCVPTEKVARSLPVIRRFVEAYRSGR